MVYWGCTTSPLLFSIIPPIGPSGHKEQMGLSFSTPPNPAPLPEQWRAVLGPPEWVLGPPAEAEAVLGPPESVRPPEAEAVRGCPPEAEAASLSAVGPKRLARPS